MLFLNFISDCNAQTVLRISDFDSLLKANDNIRDLSFPNKINIKIKKSTCNIVIDHFGNQVKLYKYYSLNGEVVKIKMIYAKNDAKNYQIFYSKSGPFYAGICFYAVGDSRDEKAYQNVPFGGSQLTAFAIKSNKHNIIVSISEDDTL